MNDRSFDLCQVLACTLPASALPPMVWHFKLQVAVLEWQLVLQPGAGDSQLSPLVGVHRQCGAIAPTELAVRATRLLLSFPRPASLLCVSRALCNPPQAVEVFISVFIL